MRAIGETAHSLYAIVKQSKMNALINLGNILVISNLGVDLLIGQPTKVDTNMVSVPHKRLVYFRDVNGTDMNLIILCKMDTRTCRLIQRTVWCSTPVKK